MGPPVVAMGGAGEVKVEATPMRISSVPGLWLIGIGLVILC